MPLSLKTILEAVDGYKSYIIAAAIAVTVGVYYLGGLTDEQFTSVLGLLGAGGLVAIKSAVAKVE